MEKVQLINVINKTYIAGDTVYIELEGKYKGRTAITDVESYFKHELHNYKWRSDKLGYVYTILNSKNIYMHRIVSGNNSSDHTDHIQNTEDPIKDKLNNRFDNLRICSNRENQLNARIKRTNTTGYKGISLYKGSYKAQAKNRGHKYYFGGFSVAKYGDKALLMAAYSYDVAAEWINGTFASHSNIKDRGLLSKEEMNIVEEVTFKKIEKHGLEMHPTHKDIDGIELRNTYVNKVNYNTLKQDLI